MEQKLQLNIIPFSQPVEKATFAFYNNPALAKQEGYYPIFIGDFGNLLDNIFTEADLNSLEKLYTDFQPAKEGAIEIEINLAET